MANVPELETIIDSLFLSMDVDQTVVEKAKTAIHTAIIHELLYTLSVRLPKQEQAKYLSGDGARTSSIITDLFEYFGEEEVKKQYRKIALLKITDFLSHLKRANL